MKPYKLYSFRHHDPILDRVWSLVEAARMTPAEVAKRTGLHISTVYAIRRTALDRGMRKYHSKNIKFANVYRVLLALGAHLADLEDKPKLRVVSSS